MQISIGTAIFWSYFLKPSKSNVYEKCIWENIVRSAPLNYSTDEFRKFRHMYNKRLEFDEKAHYIACFYLHNFKSTYLSNRSYLIYQSTKENCWIVTNFSRKSFFLAQYVLLDVTKISRNSSINLKSSFLKNRTRTGYL